MTVHRRARKRAALLAFGILPGLAACIEQVTIGGNYGQPEGGADARETEPPRDSAVDCPEGQALQMGRCVPRASACSTLDLDGSCPDGQSCEMGLCVTLAPTCSVEAPDGSCPPGGTCQMGTCVDAGACSPMEPDSGGCGSDELCTPLGTCQVNPCLMSPCTKGLLCCPMLAMSTYIADCVMGMKCP